MENSSTAPSRDNSWQSIVTRYNKPKLSSSLLQILTSFGPYILLWAIMIILAGISPWLALAVTIPAAGFLIRIFIIFHDCGHGSFSRSAKMNRIIGIISGAMAFTPYDMWTDKHRIHHATVGNLDKRGTGDVWTLTVEEYLGLSKLKPPS